MSQKTDVPGIFKEREGVLINKDNDALMAYKIKLQRAREADALREDVTELKKDIQEIKDLLKGLIK
jgi:polyhydroxyalkanoate synthesis regulator phasin